MSVLQSSKEHPVQWRETGPGPGTRTPPPPGAGGEQLRVLTGGPQAGSTEQGREQRLLPEGDGVRGRREFITSQPWMPVEFLKSVPVFFYSQREPAGKLDW